MALSMDEQRMLAEIEQRLAAQDPRLAADLSLFRKPGRLGVLRSTRARVVGSLFTVVVVAMVSLMVYAMLPFRSGARTTGNHPVTTTSSTNSGPGQAKIGAAPGTSSAARSSAATAGTTTQSAAGKTSASAQAPAGKTSKISAQAASKPAVAQSGTSASAVRSP